MTEDDELSVTFRNVCRFKRYSELFDSLQCTDLMESHLDSIHLSHENLSLAFLIWTNILVYAKLSPTY